jgi:hypothetical protein
LEDSDVEGRMILKWILHTRTGGGWHRLDRPGSG